MKNLKKIIALMLCVVMAFSMTACGSKTGLTDDGTQTAITEGINGAGKFLVKKITSPSYGDETAIIALNRSTYIDYWHNRSTLYDEGLAHVVKSNGYVLGKDGKVYADGYDDVILAHTTIGILADKSQANNFIDGISYDSVVMQGGYLNKVRALIALECGKYTMSEKGDLTRGDLIDFVMGLYNENGYFDYAGLHEETPVLITANAVTGLALSGEAASNPEIAAAIESGVEYLKGHIRETDSPEDIVATIIALNTTGHSGQDVEGKDLTARLLAYQREDGSCSFDTQDKKGNVDDTALVLLGLASQYRFNTGMTSIYDMSDVLGGTHNKLSPEWSANMKLMTYFVYAIIIFLVSLFIVSRFRIIRWRKMNLLEPGTNKVRAEVSIEELNEFEAKYKACKGKGYPVYAPKAPQPVEETVEEQEETPVEPEE